MTQRMGIRPAFNGRPWERLRFHEKFQVVFCFIPFSIFLGFFQVAVWIDLWIDDEQDNAHIGSRPPDVEPVAKRPSNAKSDEWLTNLGLQDTVKEDMLERLADEINSEVGGKRPALEGDGF